MSKLFSQITKMTSHLGVTVDRPYFTHAGRIYYYTHDPPHLLKSVQNNLFKYTTFFGDQKAAKWFDITHFYETDQKQRFRLTPKLTSCHVGLPAFSKMKVKLAAQVISRTVAAALETHSHVGSGASEMAEFSMQFNDLFDCMNSSRLRDANRLKWPLSVKGTCDQTKFLNACFNWLTTICVQTDSGKYVTNEVKCFADGSCPLLHSLNLTPNYVAHQLQALLSTSKPKVHHRLRVSIQMLNLHQHLHWVPSDRGTCAV